MKTKKIVPAFLSILFLSFFISNPAIAKYNFQNDAVKISIEWQHDTTAVDANSILAIHFETSENWHFYADAKTAPAPNLYLQIDAQSAELEFKKPIFPFPSDYFDKTQNKTVRVYSKNFTVYLPFKVVKSAQIFSSIIVFTEVNINGAYCSDIQCRILGEQIKIQAPFIINKLSTPKFQLPKQTIEIANTPTQNGSLIIIISKLAISFLVGLLFNVMPCVLPVIPLVITKLINQSRQNKTRSLALGFTFCLGIISFFAALAILNIILKLGFGTVFQWGDYFRYPWFIKAMSLLLILLGLFMFGLFTIGIPSSVAGKAGSGEGFAGAIGMGFLAALLGTPCSFGILAGVFAWAQTQNLFISTAVMLTMGAGMAAPYAILILMPSLLKKLPKPGDWMERIKQAMGFVLLIIAVKLLEALSPPQLIATLYFAVVLSIGVWMWGSWVNFTTPKKKKYTVRLIALAIIVGSGFYFLPVRTESLIDWQSYDTTIIEQARQQGKTVIIKFDAKWCASCKIVDKRVYQNKVVAQFISAENILMVRGDTTDASLPATADLKNIYHEPGIPVSIIWLPGKTEPIKLRGLINKKQLLEALKKID